MAVRIQQEPFDLGAEVAALTEGRADIGAVVTFTGLVRDRTDAAAATADVTALELEHYPGMTERALEAIEREAWDRWPLKASLIIHRHGPMALGEPIVLVVAASAHRQAAFEAASFLMDYLKTRAPFWKKETRPGGDETWVDARETDDAAADRWRSAAEA